VTLVERIRKRQAVGGVVGMGRVGLPLAIALGRAGLRVLGLEQDERRRQDIGLGKLPFREPGAERALNDAAVRRRFSVHGAAVEVVPQSDIIILCVGTPLGANLRPDYRELEGALANVVPHLRTRQMLMIRSTVSPGTLLKVILPYLRSVVPEVAGGLLLASCPERIAPGKAMEEVVSLPELVGGIDAESSRAAAALFLAINPNKQIHVTDPTSAELAKLFTNVYRYVTFALANEFAIISEYYGVNVHRILETANDHYPRAGIPIPGPAGGPCLTKDGYFLLDGVIVPDFVLLASRLNDSIPAHVVRRLSGKLAAQGESLEGAAVAVLGQSYKRDVDDQRDSPAVRVSEILRREGADVRSHDPFSPGPSIRDALHGAGAFVLATNHSFYETLNPTEVAGLMLPPRIGIDSWGMLDQRAFAHAGVQIFTFGVGDGV